MDRIHTPSDPSFSRSSDYPSYRGNYVSPSGYRSSLSVYNAFEPKLVSRDGYGLAGGFSDRLSRDELAPLSIDGLGIKEDPAGPLSRDGYGGYSYSSSFDDMRKSANGGSYSYSKLFEGSKYLESSAHGEYGYEPDKASSFHESYRGPSSAPYDKSLSSFDGSLASSSPLTSSLYGVDGQNFGSRHQDFSYGGTVMQYDYLGLNKSSITSLNKPDVLAFEQSAGERERNATSWPYDLTYPTKDTSGLSGVAPDYELASGLSRKYASNISGMFPTLGELGDWRNAGGRVYDTGSLLSNVKEPYNLGRAGNGLRVMDGSVYTDMNNINKYGMWDGGVVEQAQPEIGQEQNISSLPALSANKVVEGSLQISGIDVGREPTGKIKRKSRWEPMEENEKNGQNGLEKKKKKSRWSEEKPTVKEPNLPDIAIGEDPDEITLRAQLIIINKKLQSGQVLDDRPEAERSPSPEPVFDNFGYRVNTREYRSRERLTKERQRIISKLSEKSSMFKSSPDFKQSKFSRKIFIPADKYPDYNFIGLIIGPRGHSQKKMEKESGAKIFIRGKGSVREGPSTLPVLNETENLHVLIEADSEESINKAATMVEKLLVPIRDEKNEHKKAQLRELATLNGTLRSNESCQVCKETGHAAKDCPMAGLIAGSSPAAVIKGDTSRDNELCHVCKGFGHVSNECPSNNHISGSLSKGGSGSLTKGDSAGSRGLQATKFDSWLYNECDETLVYVAFLPLSVNDAQLQSLFAPFGQVVHAKVMRHLTTGVSKSYGFVKFLEAADAAQAVALMNGYKLEGKVLVVKLKMNAGAVS